jgi:transcription-repair coupling factor (superfamily II helicase)
MSEVLVLDRLPLPTAAQPRVTWAGLHGSAESLALAEAAARHSGTVVVVAPTAAAADRFEREAAFFGAAPSRFPDYETLPYEAISPPQDLLADRLHCLYRLARGERQLLVVEAGALLNRLPPPEFVVQRSLFLKVGDRFERNSMIQRLMDHGYLRVEQVSEPGEFAVRGAVLDVYPTGSGLPVRIDLFDDEVETLRTFDPQTQLTAGQTDQVRMLPAREFPIDEAAIKYFRERFRDRFPVEPGRCPIYRTISEAQLPAGIEYYLPLFFKTTATLLDYLGNDALFVMPDGALDGIDAGWRLVEERYEQAHGDIEHPILKPHECFVPPADLRTVLDARPMLALAAHEVPEPDTATFNAGVSHPLAAGVAADEDRIKRWLGGAGEDRTLLATSSPGHREMMLDLARNRGFHPGWSARGKSS